MIHHQTHRAVRRQSEPIAPKARHVPPPRPPAGPPARPQIDAYELVHAWKSARLLRDWANAARLLAELERLATRRKPRAGGEDDEPHG